MNILEQLTMEHLCNLDSKIPELTLRDLFAIAIINGFSANTTFDTRALSDIAKLAYEQADEMLKARQGE